MTRKRKENSENDDSLTNLHWLTGVNLDDILVGKPIQLSCTEEGCDVSRARRCLAESTEYKRECDIKPPYSYAVLIIMAMKSKGTCKMTLREIYDWISENFVFYRHAEPTWKNSIRHNLSLNKCFEKVPRKKGEPGKGGYWSIVPEFANKILENNIRKRCSRVCAYDNGNVSVKRRRLNRQQRLDVLHDVLSGQIKSETVLDDVTNDVTEEKLTKTIADLVCTTTAEVTTTTTTTTPPRPEELFANLEHCHMDHPYGKNPTINYSDTDEDNIRAIASHLIETTSNVDDATSNTNLITATATTTSVCLPTMNSLFNSFTNGDCMWSSEHNNNLAESMSKITKELLEARNLTPSNYQVTDLDDDLDDKDDHSDSFCEELESLQEEFDEDDIDELMIRGTKATLFTTTADIISPLSETALRLIAT